MDFFHALLRVLVRLWKASLYPHLPLLRRLLRPLALVQFVLSQLLLCYRHFFLLLEKARVKWLSLRATAHPLPACVRPVRAHWVHILLLAGSAIVRLTAAVLTDGAFYLSGGRQRCVSLVALRQLLILCPETVWRIPRKRRRR